MTSSVCSGWWTLWLACVATGAMGCESQTPRCSLFACEDAGSRDVLPDDTTVADDATRDAAAGDAVSDAAAGDAVSDAAAGDAVSDAPGLDAQTSDASADAGAAITCAAGGGWPFTGVSRACAGDSDCIAVTHQTDCCGNARVTGVSARDAEAFRTHEAHCASLFPACGCPARQPTADDGNTVSDPSGVAVHCVAAQCTTVVASHG